MSQPSSQTAGMPAPYRQYTDIPPKPPNDPDMGIYSVRPSPPSLTPLGSLSDVMMLIAV